MTIPPIKVPYYTLELPISKKKVKYRPFLVKEQKVLVNANEQGNPTEFLDIIGSIISDCTNGEIDIETDPMFEVQYAFLQIRGKSIGETIPFVLVCANCEHKKATQMDISEFTLTNRIGHTKEIDFGNGTIVKMRYPTFKHFSTLFEDDSEMSVYEVVAECIDSIVDEDQVFHNDGTDKQGMLDWVNNLTPEQFKKFEDFFATMPILEKTMEYTCEKCKTNNRVTIDGIRNFFV